MENVMEYKKLSVEDCEKALHMLFGMLPKDKQKSFLSKELVKLKRKGKNEEQLNEVLTKVYELPEGVTYAYPVCTTEAKNIKTAGINRNYNYEVIRGLRKVFSDEKQIGCIKEIPVIVYYDEEEKGFVLLDGHHRKYVLEELNKPIYFSVFGRGKHITKEEAKLVMIETNKYQRQWKQKNFGESHSKSGNKDFIRACDFIEEQNGVVLVGTAKAALFEYYKSDGNGPIRDIWKEGWINITDEMVERARKNINDIKPIIEAFNEIHYFGAKSHKSRYMNAVLFAKAHYGDDFNINHFVNNIFKYGKTNNLVNPKYELCFYYLASLYNLNLGKRKPIDSSSLVEASKKYHANRKTYFDEIKAKYRPEKLARISKIRNI